MLQKISNTFRYLMIGSLLIAFFVNSEGLWKLVSVFWLFVMLGLLVALLSMGLVILTKSSYKLTKLKLNKIKERTVFLLEKITTRFNNNGF